MSEFRNYLESNRDAALEATRGLAALTVMGWHCLIGFYPEHSGFYRATWPGQTQFSDYFWFGILNGPAAVTVFFVLSGFVLTRRYFLDGDLVIPVRGVLKRWPRLLGPVVITVIASYLMFVAGAYRFSEAAQYTGSEWLKTFAYGIDPKVFSPNILDAFFQGLFGTFFDGSYSYDSSLWTMKYELVGSLFVFSFAVLSRPLLMNRLSFFVLSAIVVLLCHATSKSYVSFFAGAILAALLPRETKPLHWILATLSTLVAFYLLSFTDQDLTQTSTRVLRLSPVDLHTIAATMLIGTVVTAEGFIRRGLGGTLGKFLGWISFPLYLIHVPLLCSVGCVALVAAEGHRIFGVIATIGSSILLSVPLALLNDFWVRKVNEAFKRWIALAPHSVIQ